MSTKRRRDNDGDVRTSTHYIEAPENGPKMEGAGTLRRGDTQLQLEGGLTIVLVELCGRGDGWLRITSDIDHDVVYVKYKLTSHRWPNHYVMYSGPVAQIARCIEGVQRKLQLVDVGQLRPTEDRPFHRIT